MPSAGWSWQPALFRDPTASPRAMARLASSPDKEEESTMKRYRSAFPPGPCPLPPLQSVYFSGSWYTRLNPIATIRT
jgi:hypothetical protein